MKNKLKLTVTVEWEIDPLDYGATDAKGAAKKQFRHLEDGDVGVETLLELGGMQYTVEGIETP